VADRIFIATMYVVALIHENDEYHKLACDLSEKYENSSFVTTDAVLLESQMRWLETTKHKLLKSLSIFVLRMRWKSFI